MSPQSSKGKANAPHIALLWGLVLTMDHEG